ncbi:hypothetical protein I6F35_21885 [Bradyrhizobium sp. BRP22]|uniref:hypothetical protein n=1 Tax=Bradyrhizobium sp. BRP22 TaxID=2793821 RepID=UPI001CD64983|nr:hypothetical protein [Bradyrhizobium sp. BRP22]MCA1455827.1 hypothetical protein [Bradyrhizobium sp. BRP22]
MDIPFRPDNVADLELKAADPFGTRSTPTYGTYVVENMLIPPCISHLDEPQLRVRHPGRGSTCIDRSRSVVSGRHPNFITEIVVRNSTNSAYLQHVSIFRV